MSSDNFLDLFVGELYQKALYRNHSFYSSIKIIDEPHAVQQILRSPDIYFKNYSFLESLSVGRLSSNGDDWKMRSSLTQPFLSKYEDLLSESDIENIYQRHFQGFDFSKPNGLFQMFIEAAMEVIFKVFQLPRTTPWPSLLLQEIRRILTHQQLAAWGQASPEQFLSNQLKLEDLCKQIAVIWSHDVAMASFLDTLKSQSRSNAFDPVKELIQVFQAASETTASALMWTVDCLSRNSEARKLLISTHDDVDYEFFLKEVLRLFPPLPFVTRVCTNENLIGDLKIQLGEVVVLSIIGLHCHPAYWKNSNEFIFRRSEFVNNSYEKGAYIPFLSGPRVCGGMKLANQELKIALRVILQTYEFKDNVGPIKMRYGITCRPDDSLTQYLSPKH